MKVVQTARCSRTRSYRASVAEFAIRRRPSAPGALPGRLVGDVRVLDPEGAAAHLLEPLTSSPKVARSNALKERGVHRPAEVALGEAEFPQAGERVAGPIPGRRPGPAAPTPSRNPRVAPSFSTLSLAPAASRARGAAPRCACPGHDLAPKQDGGESEGDRDGRAGLRAPRSALSGKTARLEEAWP